eukprot:COSAG06_NODE_185_length_20838_cov_50.259463_4_plen_102_part_00
MAFVASHYLAPIAAIQQRIRTKKAAQLDSENFYIRSSAAHFGAAINPSVDQEVTRRSGAKTQNNGSMPAGARRAGQRARRGTARSLRRLDGTAEYMVAAGR